jgi:cation/acetate symporter
MASNTSGRSSFVDDLARVYWTYALSFAVFVTLAAILEQVGVPDRVLGYLFVLFTLGAYATIGALARTMQVAEFFVAARRVPGIYNGMACAASCLGGAMFVALPGVMYVLGWDGLGLILGLGGGLVLIAVLIAPYLRKFGAYTVPDFLALRFGGLPARLVAIVILACCSLAYLTAQIHATGIVLSRFLAIGFESAVVVALAAMLASTVLGGMRSLTWSQVAQYIIMAVALVVPAVVTAIDLYGNPLPQLALGDALIEITSMERELLESRLASPGEITPHLAPFATLGERNFIALAVCLMLGTASLPHIVMRFFTTGSVRQSRTSVAWALLFLLLLVTLAPAYAAFAKVEIFGSVIGSSVAALPDWVAHYSGLDLVAVYGLSVSGVETVMAGVAAAIADGAAEHGAVAAGLDGKAAALWNGFGEPVRAAIFNAVSEDPASRAGEVWRRAILSAAVTSENYAARLPLAQFSIDRDAILIAAPEIAGLPYVFAGVVAAGALAAGLSTANGLLVAIANTMSHDVYYRTLDPEASTAKRLVVSRVFLVLVACAAAWLAASRQADVLSVVTWAFSLAAAGFFPALVLGIWWKRATSWGAVAGMLAGFSTALAILVVTRFAPEEGVRWLAMTPAPGDAAALAGRAIEAMVHLTPSPAISGQVGWFGVSSTAIAVIGVPVGFVVMIIVSLVTPAPSQAMSRFIDDIRTPRGRSHMEAERVAERVREFGRGRR